MRTKKACGVIHPAGFDAWRWILQAQQVLEALREPFHEGGAQRRARCARGKGQGLSEVHGEVSRESRRKTKDPVACGLPGLCELRRPSLRNGMALGHRFEEVATRRDHRCGAGRRVVLRGEESGHRNLWRRPRHRVLRGHK